MTEQTLGTRYISGTGQYQIIEPSTPPRYYSILVDVLRPPKVFFPSNKYSPQRQRYATMVSLRGGYVIGEYAIDYARYRIDLLADDSGQTLIAVKCAYQGILQTFYNLGNALSLPSISIVDLVVSFTSINFLPDTLQFVCEDSTFIQVSVVYDFYDTCNPGTPKEKKPPIPPPTPTPPAPVSPATSLSSLISPAYPSGDSVTSPNSLDVYTPPALPHGVAGLQYTVSWTFDLLNTNDTFYQTENGTGTIYGPITGYGITNDLTTIPNAGSGAGFYCLGHTVAGAATAIHQGFGGSHAGNLRNVTIVP